MAKKQAGEEYDAARATAAQVSALARDCLESVVRLVSENASRDSAAGAGQFVREFYAALPAIEKLVF